jgi:hypothetical protein
MRLYAQPEDLIPEWLDVIPGNAHRLIRAASVLVENATRLGRYDTDAEGYPTQPNTRSAFLAAVCQQVAVWHNADIDPDKGLTGQQATISSQSAGGGSVSYTGTQTTQERGLAAVTLCDQSYLILRNAGLLHQNVRHRR